MTEEDPDLLAGDNLDKLRGRNPYPAMSERFRLSEELDNAQYQNNLLIEKCRQLEVERDEARREVCGFHHLTGFLCGEYAKSRGWDCYKDAKRVKFSQSVLDFKEFLKGQDNFFIESNDRIRKEYDEYRLRIGRIYNEIDCRIEHGADSNGHLEAIHKMLKGNL